MKTKQLLRSKIRDRRRQLTPDRALEFSERIAERALTLPEYGEAQSVLSYASLREEVNTRKINERVLTDGKRLFLPKVVETGVMYACQVTHLFDLHLGKMGILEPDSKHTAFSQNIALAFVPGIAFDKRGGRIGFGGGYYDRFLEKTGALRVALAYEMQIVEDVCACAHDQMMDMLITEERIYDFRTHHKDKKTTDDYDKEGE